MFVSSCARDSAIAPVHPQDHQTEDVERQRRQQEIPVHSRSGRDLRAQQEDHRQIQNHQQPAHQDTDIHAAIMASREYATFRFWPLQIFVLPLGEMAASNITRLPERSCKSDPSNPREPIRLVLYSILPLQVGEAKPTPYQTHLSSVTGTPSWTVFSSTHRL